MATTTTTRTYQIDKAHSEATFQVRYLLTKVRGRFSDFDGTIQFDEANPENSSIDFTIQAASIDTNESRIATSTCDRKTSSQSSSSTASRSRASASSSEAPRRTTWLAI